MLAGSLPHRLITLCIINLLNFCQWKEEKKFVLFLTSFLLLQVRPNVFSYVTEPFVFHLIADILTSFVQYFSFGLFIFLLLIPRNSLRIMENRKSVIWSTTLLFSSIFLLLFLLFCGSICPYFYVVALFIWSGCFWISSHNNKRHSQNNSTKTEI